jgi:hypothetical protein
VNFFLIAKVHTKAEGIALICSAVFKQNVITAEAYGHTRRIKDTVFNGNVVIIKACYAVITRIKITVFDPYMITGTKVHTVVTAVYRDIFDADILGMENCMGPIAAVNEGIPFKPNIATAPKTHTVGTAEFVFALGVITVAPVNIGAPFANDRDVFGVKSTNQAV